MLHAEHDGKVGCSTVEYTAALLYFDWLTGFPYKQSCIHKCKNLIFESKSALQSWSFTVNSIEKEKLNIKHYRSVSKGPGGHLSSGA